MLSTLQDRNGLIVLLLALFTLASCRSVSTELPTVKFDQPLFFEEVALEQHSPEYAVPESESQQQLLLLSAQEELAAIESYVTSEDFELLQQVDFSQTYLIALFRGNQPTDDRQVRIERIGIMNDRITVVAQFWEPFPDTPASAVVTFPYHIVAIDRNSFDLDVDEPNLELVSYTIFH